MKIDFHVHTKFSIDSISEPKKIIEISRRTGIIPAITDHNKIDAHAVFRSLDPKFKFIPAEEVTTDLGDLIGLFVSEPIKKKTPFLEVVDNIKSQGGLTYIPHMFDITRGGVANKELAKKVDIIETFNGRCVLQGANQKADAFAEENKKPKAAGSDSHFTLEFGKTYTEFADCDLEPRRLLKALGSKKVKLHCHYSPIYLKGITHAIVAYKKLFGKLGNIK